VDIKLDALVKSQKCPRIVIPVKTGIQRFQRVTKHWTPVFTGVTTFYENIKLRFHELPLPDDPVSMNFMNMKLRFHHSLCPRRAWEFYGI